MRLYKTIQYLLLLAFSASLLIFTACGDDGGDGPPEPEKTQQELATEKLVGNTWSLQSVTRNSTDVSSDFSGFTITFTSSGFTTTNGTGAWESSGTWTWTDAQAKSFTLENGVAVQVEFSNNDTVLTLTFTVEETTFDIGRTTGLAGNYVFVLGS